MKTELPTENAMQAWVRRFHEHLDVCEQCRNHPFALCKAGALLLCAVPEEPIKVEPGQLSRDVAALREIPAEWKKRADPLAELQGSRNGEKNVKVLRTIRSASQAELEERLRECERQREELTRQLHAKAGNPAGKGV